MNKLQTTTSKKKEKLAPYLYDLSKISFTGWVIGIAVPMFSEGGNWKMWRMWLLAAIGLALTILLAKLANKML